MDLQGKRVAILAENNYQDLELWYLLLRMREAGAEVKVVGHVKVVAKIRQDRQTPDAFDVQIHSQWRIRSGDGFGQEHVVVAADHQLQVAVRADCVVDPRGGSKPPKTSGQTVDDFGTTV